MTNAARSLVGVAAILLATLDRPSVVPAVEAADFGTPSLGSALDGLATPPPE